MTLQILQLPKRIYIIDDNLNTAEDIRDQVQDLDIEPILITSGHFHNTSEIWKTIDTKDAGIICDHRLQHGDLADFFGSELVSLSYRNKIPALLLTQYKDQDIDTTIRKYRRDIPFLVEREYVEPSLLRRGFEICAMELSSGPAPERAPHKTLIRVASTSREGDNEVADAFLDSWRPQKAVRFPLSLMGEEEVNYIKAALARDTRHDVFMTVTSNIGAADDSDLYFTDFSIPVEHETSPFIEAIQKNINGEQ